MFRVLTKIIRSGYSLFWQEKLITLVSIGTTIVISLFIWSGFLSFYFFNKMILYLEERLDFSIYFKVNTPREEILKIQKIIKNFPEAEEVMLITQEEALERFKEEVKTNPVIYRALKEININPLVDYLIVKAKSPEDYPKIIDYLEKSPYKVYIDYVSYFENQKVIEKIISLSNKVKAFISIFIVLVLSFSALIIFNVILVSVYSQKDDIEVLRLIGASDFFVIGPFLVYSFIFTFVGYLLFLSTFIIFFEKTVDFWTSLISNFQPLSFIYNNFFILNGVALAIILFINWISTIFALQRYLRI